MRSEFKNIISGWMLTDDFNLLSEIIERAAEWTKRNSSLLPDEQAVMTMMIERQIALGLEIYPLTMPNGQRVRIADLNRN